MIREELVDKVRERVEHDLRLRFPDLSLTITGDVEFVHVAVNSRAGFAGGGTSLQAGDDVEAVIVDLLLLITDNMWPDDATDPWPPCPVHHDHPLYPGLVGGRATWGARHDCGPVIRVGDLR